MSNSLRTLAPALPVLLLACAAAADGPRLEDFSDRPLRPARIGQLAWQAGHWSGAAGERVTRQVVTCPAGGMQLGLQQDLDGQRSVFFEFQRYQQIDGGIVFFAQPLGREPTPFVLVELGEQSAVFENTGHDFPQRIAMSRDGDALTGRIEGLVDGTPRASSWTWRRDPDSPACAPVNASSAAAADPSD